MMKLPVERRGESLYCAVQDVFQISHFSFPGFAQLAILLKRNEKTGWNAGEAYGRKKSKKHGAEYRSES